jgi:integrase
MVRAVNRLTPLKVKNVKSSGMHADGGGLYLRVSPKGTKSWIFRYGIGGKLRDMGLGSINDVSLAAARRRARELRDLRTTGKDPITHQRAAVAAQRASDARSITFQVAAERWLAIHEAGWVPKHARVLAGMLRDHAFPTLGALPVRMIDTALIVQTLAPLWMTKGQTAKRLRGRIESILDWARVAGFREGENPARWRGHLEHTLSRQVVTRTHHAALPYQDLSRYMAKLRELTGPAARCLEFVILTAVRLGEARLASWDEISGDAWTIPAAHMKNRRAHRVPLSKEALAVLDQMCAVRRSEAIFHGMYDAPVAAITVLTLAKQVAGAPITVHGFRSSFRDWAGEQTSFPREVVEQALAHAVGSAVERAYARSDLFDKRRRLMESWGEHCAQPSARGDVGGN